MAFLNVNGARIYYEEQGSGPETIVFAHGFLWSCRMFDSQIQALKNHYRCVAFDFRGQGKSEVTKNGYDMDSLYEDVVSLVETLNCKPCHFAGLSMGGMVGLRLAARRPDLVRSLILMDTSADPESRETIKLYKKMVPIFLLFGPRLIVDRVMQILFGKWFLTDPDRREEQKKWRKRLSDNSRIGISHAAKGVYTREGVQSELKNIKVPTLVIVGEDDVSLPPAHSERLQNGIAGARLVRIPHAGHTCTVEEPAAVNKTIRDFLCSLK